MRVVTDKYRGSTNYVHVLAELVRAAEYRGVTTYQNIAAIMQLPLKGNHMQREVGHILGEIAEDETRGNRPLLSAIAVNVSGAPGSGFFSLARELGLLTGDEDETAYWERERDAVYGVWRRPLPEWSST